MDNLAIVFIYSHRDLLTSINYSSIEKHSRGVPIYAVHQHDFPNNYYDFLDYKHVSQWAGIDIWYWGSDNLFLYWYLSNPDKRAKNYLILEYDTYAAEDIQDFLGLDEEYLSNHYGISSVFTIFAKTFGYGYWWFDVQRHNPIFNKFFGIDNFCAISPLCSTLVSDDAVSAVVEHLKEYPHHNKVYVETKMATILKYMNFNVLNLKTKVEKPKEYVSYEQQICINNIRRLAPNPGDIVTSGIHHPIKDTSILWRYFMTTQSIPKDDIHKAYFGSLYNAKPALDTLNKAGVQKVVIDNSLCGDPAGGLRKQLYLEYEKDGELFKKTFQENEVLDFDTL